MRVGVLLALSLAFQTVPPPKSPTLIVGVSTIVGLAHIAVLRAQRPETTPVPLDTDGSATRGVVYDRVMLGELRARAIVVASRDEQVRDRHRLRVRHYVREADQDRRARRDARVSTAIADDGITMLDVYELQYAGLEKPIRLFLDFYHFVEPQAPVGLACATPIRLSPPK
jgi:hypothetical protein